MADYGFEEFLPGRNDESDYAHLKREDPMKFKMSWQPDNIKLYVESDSTLADYARQVSVFSDPERIVMVRAEDNFPEMFRFEAGDITEKDDGSGIWAGHIGFDYDDIDGAEINDPQIGGIERFSWSPAGSYADVRENLVGLKIDSWNKNVIRSLIPENGLVHSREFGELLDAAEIQLEETLDRRNYSTDVF